MTNSLTFEQVLNKRVRYYNPRSQSAVLTGVVKRADPTNAACVVMHATEFDHTYNVELALLTLIPASSLEHDLRSMVVRLEATAQLCGDGAGGLARAAAEAKIAAQLRGLLKQHGHDCAPCKVYSSSKEALAALTKADA